MVCVVTFFKNMLYHVTCTVYCISGNLVDQGLKIVLARNLHKTFFGQWIIDFLSYPNVSFIFSFFDFVNYNSSFGIMIILSVISCTF